MVNLFPVDDTSAVSVAVHAEHCGNDGSEFQDLSGESATEPSHRDRTEGNNKLREIQ